MRKELTFLVPIGIGIAASAMINKKMKSTKKGLKRYSHKMMKSFL